MPLPHFFRFRIRALVKVLAEPDLPPAYARAARRMLAAKCAVYAQGCDKRGKNEEAAWYRNQGWEANPNGLKEAIPAVR